MPNEKIEALVIGGWDESFEQSPQDLLNALIENASKLTIDPAL